MLRTEHGYASNITNETVRQVVLDAITATQTILEETYLEGNPIQITFEPVVPIETSLYLIDNRFHTEAVVTSLQNA